MTALDGLLQAILDNPGDDGLRLIYADCCEESGDEGHASFIRDCVWMAANHTDCPVRLQDVKRGRPVPLRCGICDYCVCRRRAEGRYAKMQWIAGTSYAVAFEPTPLDGDMLTGPGLTLIVRRGFVAEIHTTLAAWMGGGPCHQCAGHGGHVHVRGDAWHESPGNAMGREAFMAGAGKGWRVNHKADWSKCTHCHGTGPAPGIGPAVTRAQPVERVVFSDREPSESHGSWYWFDDRRHPATLTPGCPYVPRELCEYMVRAGWSYDYERNWSSFATREQALVALSAAALAWARQQPVG